MSRRNREEEGPLAGMRVVEIGGGIAAAFCSRMLRGFGADTVRVESDDGQLTADELVFLVSGSRRVHARDVDLLALVAGADIIVEDRGPGWLGGHGLDPDELIATRPELIITSISPFGQTGPHAHWQTTNAVQFAVGGLMSLTGEPYREPLTTGGSQAYFLGGLHAFAATTIACLRRQRHGVGDWIDISLQECAASMPELYGAMSEYELRAPAARAGNSVRSTWGVYRCADGFAGVCCLERQTPAFFSLLGEVVSGDERFTDPTIRPDHDDELLAHVMSFMLNHTKEELSELSPLHRVPFGAVRTPAELLSDQGYAERRFFDRVVTAEGEAVMPGRPFPGLRWTPPDRLHDRTAQPPWPPREAVPNPRPGWRSREATAEPDKAETTPNPRPGWRSREATAEPSKPRILDLTMMWAGPYATKLLAETGAEIIKIESPSAWDNIRTLVPQDPDIPDPWNSAYYFNEYNHSKKSLTLDLAQDAGRQIFLELVAEADVVIENYRAEVLDKLGLGYDVLRAANESIVLVSMAGFGKTGPMRDHVGFGPIIEMMSGLMSLTGYHDDDPDDAVPYKCGISYGDPVGGLNAVAAVALSLLQRELNGSGRHIDLAQRETASTLAGPAFVAASLRGQDPRPTGNRDPRFVPQGCYPAEGEDQWVVISVRSDEEWSRVCRLLDRPDLGPFGLDERRQRHDELDHLLSAWTSRQPAAETERLLQDIGVPAGAVLDTFAIHDDPHLVERRFYVEVPNEKMRPYRQTGPTWRFTRAPRHHMVRSPWFGEHNEEILGDLLQLGRAELQRLAASDVIGTEPINPSIG